MLVYLTMMGPQGMKQLANISLNRAHYLAEKLVKIPGVKLAFPQQAYFNEFTIALEQPAKLVLEKLKHRGILGGIGLELFYPDLKNCFIAAVTEMNTPEELDTYVDELRAILSEVGNATGKEVAKVAATK